MPSAIPVLNFNMAILVFKFRLAVYTSELRSTIICQKLVDWNSQSPKAFEGILLALNGNQDKAFECPLPKIKAKHDGQTKYLVRILRLVIQYNAW
jgi:hypothetical protein